MSARQDPPAAPRRVVALRYDPAVRAAPAVVAKGKGEAAERIRARARDPAPLAVHP